MTRETRNVAKRPELLRESPFESCDSEPRVQSEQRGLGPVIQREPNKMCQALRVGWGRTRVNRISFLMMVLCLLLAASTSFARTWRGICRTGASRSSATTPAPAGSRTRDPVWASLAYARPQFSIRQCLGPLRFRKCRSRFGCSDSGGGGPFQRGSEGVCSRGAVMHLCRRRQHHLSIRAKQEAEQRRPEV